MGEILSFLLPALSDIPFILTYIDFLSSDPIFSTSKVIFLELSVVLILTGHNIDPTLFILVIFAPITSKLSLSILPLIILLLIILKRIGSLFVVAPGKTPGSRLAFCMSIVGFTLSYIKLISLLSKLLLSASSLKIAALALTLTDSVFIDFTLKLYFLTFIFVILSISQLVVEKEYDFIVLSGISEDDSNINDISFLLVKPLFSIDSLDIVISGASPSYNQLN